MRMREEDESRRIPRGTALLRTGEEKQIGIVGGVAGQREFI